ncbi:TRAP transporter large permease [Brevibacillus sp. NRS-1366]|uniref:TRAP transporter large permease n=1 Tax=Brevibacillus sp. NRS-1366 TaxID=3233899 RepID=UPI003D19A8A4
MSATVIALLGILALFILMMLRMPISFAMFLVGFIGLVVVASPEAAFKVTTTDLWSQFSDYSLSVIPMYILMGEVVFRAGITDKLFHAAYKWVGQLKGGMAWTIILASAGFGSICGSNSATAAMIGTMAIPEMKKYKYDDALSTGSIAGGGTLGIIIPPSTVLLVIALQMELSIRDLFIASIVPSILLVSLFLLTVWVLCQRNPELGPAGPKSTMLEKMKVIPGVFPTLALLVFVIGGLFMGWFTATESGAIGTFGALVYAVILKKLTWENFKKAAFDTLRASAMVVMLVASALVFGRFLTITRLPFEVADWVSALPLHPFFIMLGIYLVFVVGGAIMDALGFLIISIPIFFPTALSLGFDPVWFAIVLCIITSVGAITPPVGINVFVVKGLAPSVPITTIFRGAGYFLFAYMVCILLLTIFPALVYY